MTQKHPFHLVDPSPWPLTTATGALSITTGGVMYMHNYNGGGLIILLGFVLLLTSMAYWWMDVTREGSFEGQHTSIVQLGIRFGMLLFIASEVMFFFAFFWAFFWASISPVPEIGSVWPPKGIEVISAFEVPLINTVILLSSGCTVTWSHHAILAGKKYDAVIALILTIIIAIIFTGFQGFEYSHATFRISDGIFGSTFYMATGFHGFHVFVGTLFITVCLVRLIKDHYTKQHHFGFESAAWYWHFVDVVWLFLFVCVYYWGGN